MIKERGLIINTADANDYWIKLLENSDVNVLGIHPPGGYDAAKSLEDTIHHMETKEWADFRTKIEKMNIDIEFEMHALSWLLPRSLFEKNPNWFRQNKEGQRTPEFNLCCTNKDALDFIKQKSMILAKIFRPSTGKYYFWIDDVDDAACSCENCAHLSSSDQALIIYNAITEGIQAVFPNDKQSYLAYCSTMEVPTSIKPINGVFLEYAPFKREFTKSINDTTSEKNVLSIKNLPRLLDYFGKDDAKVLEYWMDNSLFSGWKLPPKHFSFDKNILREDINYYKSLGFENITSFACFLGENYYDEHKEYPDIKGYGNVLKNG